MPLQKLCDAIRRYNPKTDAKSLFTADIVKAAADPNFINQYDKETHLSPLYLAITLGHLPIIKILINEYRASLLNGNAKVPTQKAVDICNKFPAIAFFLNTEERKRRKTPAQQLIARPKPTAKPIHAPVAREAKSAAEAEVKRKADKKETALDIVLLDKPKESDSAKTLKAAYENLHILVMSDNLGFKADKASKLYGLEFEPQDSVLEEISGQESSFDQAEAPLDEEQAEASLAEDKDEDAWDEEDKDAWNENDAWNEDDSQAETGDDIHSLPEEDGEVKKRRDERETKLTNEELAEIAIFVEEFDKAKSTNDPLFNINRSHVKIQAGEGKQRNLLERAAELSFFGNEKATLIKFLISKGADPGYIVKADGSLINLGSHDIDPNIQTVLDLAIRKSSDKFPDQVVVHSLLKSLQRVRHKEKILDKIHSDGSTLLGFCIERGMVEIVDLLIKYGASIYKSSKGIDPLNLVVKMFVETYGSYIHPNTIPSGPINQIILLLINKNIEGGFNDSLKVIYTTVENVTESMLSILITAYSRKQLSIKDDNPIAKIFDQAKSIKLIGHRFGLRGDVNYQGYKLYLEGLWPLIVLSEIVESWNEYGADLKLNNEVQKIVKYAIQCSSENDNTCPVPEGERKEQFEHKEKFDLISQVKKDLHRAQGVLSSPEAIQLLENNEILSISVIVQLAPKKHHTINYVIYNNILVELNGGYTVDRAGPRGFRLFKMTKAHNLKKEIGNLLNSAKSPITEEYLTNQFANACGLLEILNFTIPQQTSGNCSWWTLKYLVMTLQFLNLYKLMMATSKNPNKSFFYIMMAYSLASIGFESWDKYDKRRGLEQCQQLDRTNNLTMEKLLGSVESEVATLSRIPETTIDIDQMMAQNLVQAEILQRNEENLLAMHKEKRKEDDDFEMLTGSSFQSNLDLKLEITPEKFASYVRHYCSSLSDGEIKLLLEAAKSGDSRNKTNIHYIDFLKMIKASNIIPIKNIVEPSSAGMLQITFASGLAVFDFNDDLTRMEKYLQERKADQRKKIENAIGIGRGSTKNLWEVYQKRFQNKDKNGSTTQVKPGQGSRKTIVD